MHIKSFKDKLLISYDKIFFILVIVFLLLINLKNLPVTYNSSLYLLEGLSLKDGHSPEILENGLLARGPILSFIFSLYFRIFSPSYYSLVNMIWLLKAVCFLSTFGIYKIGEEIKSKKVGLMASTFFLTSFTILFDIIFQIDTDLFAAFFAIYFIYFFIKSLNYKNKIYALIAGVFLGISFLTKETAGFSIVSILLILIILLIKRKIADFYLVLIPFLVALSIILPWGIYVFIKTNSFWPILGAFNPRIVKLIGNENNLITSFFQNCLELPSILYKFYNKFLSKVSNSFSAIFMLFSIIIFIPYRYIISKNINLLFMFLFFISYIPVIIATITVGSTMRQCLLPFVIIFISFSIFIVDLTDKLKNNKYKILIKITYFMIPFFLLLHVTYQYKKNIKHLHFYKSIESFISFSNPQISSRFTREEADAAAFLRNLIKDNKVNIITDDYLAKSFLFYLNNKYNFSNFDFRKLENKVDSQNIKNKILFIFTNKSFKTHERYHHIKIIDGSYIGSKVVDADYIVFRERCGFLNNYFNITGGAKLIYSNSSVFIFKKDPLVIKNNIQHDVIYINSNFFSDMDWLRKNYKDEYIDKIRQLEKLNIKFEKLKTTAYAIKGEFF